MHFSKGTVAVFQPALFSAPLDPDTHALELTQGGPHVHARAACSGYS